MTAPSGEVAVTGAAHRSRRLWLAARMPVPRSSGVVVLGFCLLATAALAAASLYRGPRILAGLFFLVAIAGPVVWLAGRLAGPLASWVTGTTVLALLIWQQFTPLAPPQVALPDWWVALTAPNQMARHRIQPPVGTTVWQTLWRRAAGAYVSICTHGELVQDGALEVQVNSQRLGFLGPAQRVPGSVGRVWYQLPVSRALVERSDVLDIAVTAHWPVDSAAGPIVKLCTDYSYRPTFGEHASDFYDGTAWHSNLRSARGIAHTVPEHAARWRYLIELRFTDARGLPTIGILY